ncbi:MAG: BTAD domain-containing putative transcriptional regulator [Acidimicrobiia bacterium]|nr:BTAD domain-containing putative transcriptional regulator [Acidimicrobiia bacterium]
MAMPTLPSRRRYLATVQIRLLGPVAAYDGDEPLPLGGMRERALLALLALSPGQVISTDRLIDELWGEDLPAKPGNALQALVSRLRRSIGSDAIVTKPPGYLLDIDPDAVDAILFRKLLADAATVADPEARGDVYRQALALWHGPALADFPFEEFAQREMAALEELRLSATEARIAADLEAGAGAELVAEIDELVAAHPLRESLRASQMLALYRAGRQADALRAYTAARETLGEELGIDPSPELRALEEKILLQDEGLTPRAEPGPQQPELPARLASFIGREREMADVIESFAASRLVTLTGPGGAGKTSLAIEVGRSLQVDYPDGVWLIELAPVTEPARVIDALVAVLQLEQVVGFGRTSLPDFAPEDTVVEYLRHRRALLILDNCEHLIDAAAHVAEAVLLSCPKVEVLATSRDRLGVPGELLWRVPPLGLAGEHSDAVELFVTRAKAVNVAFDPTPDDLHHIADICRRVDGMPLAIELAAARARSLAVGEIARRLDDGIAVLSDRQQTLREAIDWSYDLLTPPERELFALLSVFHGTFSLAAVEAIGGDLEALERLIDSSMVAPVSGGGEVRYRLLETLRVYAAERLATAEELDNVMATLLDFYAKEMAGAEDGLRGPDQLDWLHRIEADHDSIRGVLDWGVEQAPAATLRLAGMIGWYWYLRGNSAEARERFRVLLDAAGEDADDRARGDALMLHSLCDRSPEHVGEGFAEARDAYVRAGHGVGVVSAQAMTAAWGRNLGETLRLLEETYAAAAELDYGWGMALVRFLQAGAALNANDNQAAAELAGEAIEGFAAIGDRWGLGYGWYQRGIVLRLLGEYDAAEEALRASLEYARPMRLRREVAPVLSELGSIAVMKGEYDRADQLLDDAERFADEMPFAGSQGMVRNAKGRLARLRGDLDGSLELHRIAIAFYEEADAHGGLAWSHSCAGFTEEMRGDLEAAMEHHRLALDHARRTSDGFAIAQALEGIGATLVATGQSERGVELIHAGLAIRDRTGTPLPAGERFDVDRALASAGAALEPAALEAAVNRGNALAMDDALRSLDEA